MTSPTSFAGSQGFTRVVSAGQSVTLLEAWGIRLLAIKCISTSTAAGQLTGSAKDPTNAFADSGTIEIPIGEGVTLESQNGNLSGYVITAPTGCTLHLIGQCG